jgi:hypothetical protein
LSFSVFVHFPGWLKSCEFLKKDSFSWSYSFSYSQATPNITRAAIISTPFSTDYFMGHFLYSYSIYWSTAISFCCVLLQTRCSIVSSVAVPTSQ